MDIRQALEIEKQVRARRESHDISILYTLSDVASLLEIIDDLRGPEDEDVKPVIDAYHAYLGGLPKVSTISQPRKKKIIAQWKAAQKGKPKEQRQSLLEFWTLIFQYASKSDFLTGRRANDRGWSPNIDFFLQASSLTKLREGVYHGQAGGQKTGSSYWI